MVSVTKRPTHCFCSRAICLSIDSQKQCVFLRNVSRNAANRISVCERREFHIVQIIQRTVLISITIVALITEYSCKLLTPPPLINYLPETTADVFLYDTYTKIDKLHSLVYQLRMFHDPDKARALVALQVSNLSSQTFCISPSSFQLTGEMNVYRLALFACSVNTSSQHVPDTCVGSGGSSRVSLSFMRFTDLSSPPNRLRLVLAMSLEGQPSFTDTLDFTKEK